MAERLHTVEYDGLCVNCSTDTTAQQSSLRRTIAINENDGKSRGLRVTQKVSNTDHVCVGERDRLLLRVADGDVT
jgi:hypothetical protein